MNKTSAISPGFATLGGLRKKINPQQTPSKNQLQ